MLHQGRQATLCQFVKRTDQQRSQCQQRSRHHSSGSRHYRVIELHMLGQAGWPGRRLGLAANPLTQAQGRVITTRLALDLLWLLAWDRSEKHGPHVCWGQSHWQPT